MSEAFFGSPDLNPTVEYNECSPSMCYIVHRGMLASRDWTVSPEPRSGAAHLHVLLYFLIHGTHAHNDLFLMIFPSFAIEESIPSFECWRYFFKLYFSL